MHLEQLTIENYKSILTPMMLGFRPGFNVLVGANSSGKTTVLEAISYANLADDPHRSTLNITEVDTVWAHASIVSTRFLLSARELIRFIPTDRIFLGVGESPNHSYTTDKEAVQERFSREELLLEFMRRGNGQQEGRLSLAGWPSMWRSAGSPNAISAALMSAGTGVCEGFSQVTVNMGELLQVSARISKQIYRFSSERQVQATHPHHPDAELLPNASNLAYCLNHLQTNNRHLFDELNRLLNRVFPTIFWVGAPPNANHQFELKVHTTPPDLRRGDLSVGINKVGTGVANALAMLYVALTAQSQRILLLEEPNSYLHPRALRELLAILSEIGSKHQFFVTTHSADVLRTIAASTVTLLEYDGQQTIARQTSGKALLSFRAGLVDLGIRLTDLHGCDRVLWVEGESEEAVFPLLLRAFAPERAEGIAVLPLHATGDFEARRVKPKKVAEIYRRLSQDSFLAPPMVGIALDRERRQESEIRQIEEDCAGVVSFLPKAMLEDYLLDADAVQKVLFGLGETEVSVDDTRDAIALASKANLLWPKHPLDKTPHAASVLQAVFGQLSSQRQSYRKAEHAPLLAAWLIEHKPQALAELRDWLQGLVEAR